MAGRREAVRLIDGQGPAAAQAGRGQGRRDLRRVVREVVDDLDAARGAEALETARHALERREAAGAVLEGHAFVDAGGDRGGGIGDVVPARHGELERDALHAERRAAGGQRRLLDADRARLQAERAVGADVRQRGVIGIDQRRRDVGAELEEDVAQRGDLQMVLGQVQEDADGGLVVDERAVAFIGLDDEQVRFSAERVAGQPAALQREQAPAGDDRGAAPLLPLSLSYDHRVINGAAAARFVCAIAQSLDDFDFD